MCAAETQLHLRRGRRHGQRRSGGRQTLLFGVHTVTVTPHTVTRVPQGPAAPTLTSLYPPCTYASQSRKQSMNCGRCWAKPSSPTLSSTTPNCGTAAKHQLPWDGKNRPVRGSVPPNRIPNPTACAAPLMAAHCCGALPLAPTARARRPRRLRTVVVQSLSFQAPFTATIAAPRRLPPTARAK